MVGVLLSYLSSRYILNIHNTDNKCLLWCLLALLHPAKDHPNIVSNYNKPESFNYQEKITKASTSLGIQRFTEKTSVKQR